MRGIELPLVLKLNPLALLILCSRRTYVLGMNSGRRFCSGDGEGIGRAFSQTILRLPNEFSGILKAQMIKCLERSESVI
jgi:hypothetical protein